MGDPRLAAALAALERGEVIAFPTDTVFGLGARIDRPAAIDRLFSLKGRTRDRPFQVLVASAADIDAVAVVTDDARALADAFMPGPLTVVLEARGGLPDLGGGDTIGVRAPNHATVSALISASGPIVASSANRSGEQTPDDVRGVREIFGDTVGAYVDGAAGHGAASTVISLVGEPSLIREGMIGRLELEQVLRRRLSG